MTNPLVTLTSEIGEGAIFTFEAMKVFFRQGVRVKQVIDQMYAVGVRSLPMTLVCGLFVGAIMAIQLDMQLKDFGAQAFLGGLVTSTTIRNVGPVLIAFMLSGKVGAYTAAELGTMRVTEQIDAIRCLGANPIRFIILPRMIAVVISSFLLLIIGLMVGIAGGVLISVLQLNVNEVQYLQNIPNFVTNWSLGTGVVKSFVFGGIIATICCYRGYTASGGAVGVGKAVKRASVEILISIVVADFTLSSLSGYLHDPGGIMIEAIGARTILVSMALWEFIELVTNSFRAIANQIIHLRPRYRETMEQLYVIGFQSLPMILFSLTFVSLMLTIEFSFHMKLVLKQDSLVPAFSTLLMLRELGPVITSLLLTSRVGASIAAEVGSMRITEQIDALHLLGIDPVEYLVIPRWIGCVFAACTLSIVSVGVAVLGGAVMGGLKLGYGVEEYFNTMFLFARMADFWDLLIKSVVFGTIIPFMGTYQGFRCEYGAEGVGRATTAAVVQSTMLIIFSDFVLTYLLYAL